MMPTQSPLLWHVTRILAGIAALLLLTLQACTASRQAVEPEPQPRFTAIARASSSTVATIDGQSVTDDDLMADDRQRFTELTAQLNVLRKERLEQFLLKKTYGEAARQAGIPFDQYLDLKILKDDISVSNRDLEAFLKQKKVALNDVKPQAKNSMLAYLRQEKHFQALRALIAKVSRQHRIETYFDAYAGELRPAGKQEKQEPTR